MNGLRKKCEKPPFLGNLGQNGQFLTVFGQNRQNRNLGTFFSRLQALTNYTEKVMNGFRENASRTYERTDRRDS